MKRALAPFLVAAALAVPAPALAATRTPPAVPARHGQPCRGEGDCNDQRRCSGDDCTDNHKSFSPEFDKSPVDHSFNFSPTICMPGSTCQAGDGEKKDQQPPKDQKPQASIGCLVPVPYHCDGPRELTNPSKLPAVVASIVKASTDLARMFAEGTISFVQNLFTTLAEE
jgi:hypothetical protein